MKRKWWKILLGSAAVLCLFIAGNFHTDAAAGKVTEKNGVVIQAYTEIGTYRVEGKYKAPSVPNGYSGYVFAGWYTDEDLATPLNADCDNANTAITNRENKYYAKFVPKEILGVRVQVSAGTTYEKENTNVRFITTVDSKYYSKVGFDVELNGKQYNGESDRVYKKLYVVNTEKVLEDYLPQNVFHGLSKFFLACKLSNVVHADYGDLMKVTPYWVTLDGTTVYGDTVNKTVNQAYTASTASVTATQIATLSRDTSSDKSSCYAQGGCTDGTYYYQAFVYQANSTQDDDRVYIAKFEMTGEPANKELILQSGNLDLHHANDMTYNKDLTYTGDGKKSGLLVICHNAPCSDRVSFVDPDTLEIVNPNDITDLSDKRIEWKGTRYEQYIQLEEGRRIFAIEYNSALKQYVVGIAGGQTFRILKPDFSDAYGKAFEPIDNELANFTRQGVGADDKYIYFVLHNRTKEPYNGHAGHVITVYDWQGNAVRVINIDSTTKNGIPLSIEPENISIYDNRFYIGVGDYNSLKLYQLNADGWVSEEIPEHEAYIGSPEDNKYYKTLEEAVQNVKAGEIITIVAENIEINSAMSVNVNNVIIKNEVGKNVVIKRSSDYVGPVLKNSADSLKITSDKNLSSSSDTSGSLTFAGNYYVGNSYIHNIESGTLELSELTFKNIETTASGAAVLVTAGTVKIENCEFKNNISRFNGGAINCDGGNMTVTECIFTSNRADNGEGGAICIANKLIKTDIDNSVFTNNTASIYGGAICNYSTAGLTITDCTFGENTSENNGGAVYHSNVGSFTLTETTDAKVKAIFQNNQSKGNGGAICIGSGTLEITGYEFIGNSANRGGAVRLNGNNTIEATISGSIFKKNIAHKYGGAISNASKKVYTDTDEAAVTISECTFGAINEGNSSPEGGAIYNETSKLKLNGINKDAEVFQGNEATNNGGAIYVLSGTVDVSGYQFANNQAPNGGAIAVCGDDTPEVKVAGTVKASSCTFDGNVASTNGGAVYLNEAAAGTIAEITNSTFVKNTTLGYGGAISNRSKKSTLEDGTIAYGLVVEECTFGKVADTENAEDIYEYANTAINDTHAYGGAIYTGSGINATRWGNTKVVDSNFYYNKATDGGAIGTTYASNVTIEVSEKQNASSLFKGNDASNHGGAIFLYGYVNGTVEKCKFEDNHSTVNGGALYADNYSNLDVTCSKFTNNTANSKGGAICNAGSSNTTIKGDSCELSYFDDNYSMSATEGGGALSVNSGTVSVSGYTFKGNDSASNGGAIYQNGALTVTDTNFITNEATLDGGAIYTRKSMTVNGCIFGGTQDTTGDLKNIATGNGGAICVVGGTTTLSKVSDATLGNQFLYNEAANGGAICVSGYSVTDKNDKVTNYAGTLNDSGSAFTGNQATKNGGAIYIDAKSIQASVSNSEFTKNQATNYGGAIYTASTMVKEGKYALSVSNCTFGGTGTTDDPYALGNQAYRGGAIWSKNGNIKSENCDFISNKASDRGGALCLTTSGEMTLTGGKFKNNYSDVGGAILTDIKMTITNVKFTDNTATKAAPVIRDTKGIAITLTGCNINKSDIIGKGNYVIN